MAQYTPFGPSYPWSVPWAGNGERFLADLLARKPKEDDTAEAHARHGKPSRFDVVLRGEVFAPRINIVNWPDYPGGEDEPEQPVKDWVEIAGTRKTSEERIENPDDDQQYVIVERTEQAVFRTNSGDIVRMTFAN
jgi:hypothetical protein